MNEPEFILCMASDLSISLSPGLAIKRLPDSMVFNLFSQQMVDNILDVVMFKNGKPNSGNKAVFGTSFNTS